MESHLDPNQITDLAADLKLDRIRSKTTSLAGAAHRLIEEVDRSIAELSGLRDGKLVRLRPEPDPPLPSSWKPNPELGRSGVPDALDSICTGAKNLSEELDRVRLEVTCHSALLRGTDLGNQAHDLVMVVSAFVQQLFLATADHDPREKYDCARLCELANGLEAAVGSLEGQFIPDALMTPRLRRGRQD